MGDVGSFVAVGCVMQIQTTLVPGYYPFGRSVRAPTALNRQAAKSNESFRKLCDMVASQVAKTPNQSCAFIAPLVKLNPDKVTHILLTLTREGAISRRRKIVDSHLRFIYAPREVSIDSVDNTISARIVAYVKSHPGTLRAPIIAEVGRKSGASAICALVKSGRLRGEMIATGTHYYVVNAEVRGA